MQQRRLAASARTSAFHNSASPYCSMHRRHLCDGLPGLLTWKAANPLPTGDVGRQDSILIGLLAWQKSSRAAAGPQRGRTPAHRAGRVPAGRQRPEVLAGPPAPTGFCERWGRLWRPDLFTMDGRDLNVDEGTKLCLPVLGNRAALNKVGACEFRL